MSDKLLRRLDEAMANAGLRLPVYGQDPAMDLTYDSLEDLTFVGVGESGAKSEPIITPGYDRQREVTYDRVDPSRNALNASFSGIFSVPDFYYSSESAQKYGSVQDFFTALLNQSPEFFDENDQVQAATADLLDGADVQESNHTVVVKNIEPLSTPDHYKIDLEYSATFVATQDVEDPRY